MLNTNQKIADPITKESVNLQKEKEQTKIILQKPDITHEKEIEESEEMNQETLTTANRRSPHKNLSSPRPLPELPITNKKSVEGNGLTPRKTLEVNVPPKVETASPRKSVEETVVVYDKSKTFSTLPLKKEVDFSDEEDDQLLHSEEDVEEHDNWELDRSVRVKYHVHDDEDEETATNRANLLKDIETERLERMKEYEQLKSDLANGRVQTNIMRSLARFDDMSASKRAAVKNDEFRTSFEKFRSSELLLDILSNWRKLVELAEIGEKDDVYSKMKSKTTNIPSFWVKQMYSAFDKRMSHPDYQIPKTNPKTVVIVGAGPAGLCSAIECRMLGANVFLLEKRNFISRNNILHLWPYTVDYLKKLSAKTFYSKFGAGSIDHIGTKQMQRLLLKIALLLGVRIFFGTELVSKKLSDVGNGDRVTIETHPPIELPPFDLLVGADGEKSSVSREFDFGRKEFSGSLSLGITFNFVNHGTKDEVALREFGISKQFRQKYFRTLLDKYGIDLENLVYYRGETHYFVMAAKKDSLIKRKVFKEELSDITELISSKNIDIENLISYVRDVGTYVGIPLSCELEKTHCSDHDVAVFDFSKRTMAEEAVKVFFPRNNEGEVGHCTQFVSLAGDSLLQPFWPLGTGCNRALLSALDTTWMLRQICLMEPGKDQKVLDPIIQGRMDAFLKMKNVLSGSVVQPYSRCSLDPMTRYGSGNVFIGVQ